MATNRGRKPAGEPRATRPSASCPPEFYSTLRDIAIRAKVSVARVIHDAAKNYIGYQSPLLQNAY